MSYRLYTLFNVLDMALTTFGLMYTPAHEGNAIVEAFIRVLGLSGIWLAGACMQALVYCLNCRWRGLAFIPAIVHAMATKTWSLLILMFFLPN